MNEGCLIAYDIKSLGKILNPINLSLMTVNVTTAFMFKSCIQCLIMISIVIGFQLAFCYSEGFFVHIYISDAFACFASG